MAADSTMPPTTTRRTRQATAPVATTAPTLPLTEADDDFEAPGDVSEMLTACEQRSAALEAQLKQARADHAAAVAATHALQGALAVERDRTESAQRRLDSFVQLYGADWIAPTTATPERNVTYFACTAIGEICLAIYDNAGSWREKTLSGIGSLRLNIVRYRKASAAPTDLRV